MCIGSVAAAIPPVTAASAEAVAQRPSMPVPESDAQDGDASMDIVDRLNVQAKHLAAKTIGVPGDEHYACLQMVKQGATVFKHRIWPLMYIYWAYTVYGILTGPSLAFALGAFVLTYLYIDLYGAVLHIVLDNPNFLKLPLIGEACLEFQFHHIIPHEITVREFRHIAADLNGIIGLEYGVNLILFNGLTDPAYRCVACCAVLNAYLGQLAHRQAHMRPEKRDAVVAVLQDLGLMVTPDTHRRHHKTYDQGFPILSGWSDAPVTFLYQYVVPSQWVWLAMFVLLTFGGIAGLIRLYLPLAAWALEEGGLEGAIRGWAKSSML
ncbi:hypothetical protein NSK_007398 [Nannochloropsis salina CCMP1776]|uniref:Lipid desaturase domain-containing protein n=1 Tax=Nannochloropsis salina CCMP1776 TaxID=1027361 RepID=A0A4D9CTS2_9STRA|nr:hypothetical protein NSK_007398 [Nannochloropsis salina CCMP1776]|eukprot:TFJ81437.1 hypothetical protein NSK_007398 [Nannochloropsis salina CCMP1776]